MNFQYLEDFDCEFLTSNFALKETFLSLNENSTEKSTNNEEKAKEIETNSKGLTLKELPRHLKYSLLRPEKEKPVIILATLTELEEQKLLKILRKYLEASAWSI